MSNSSTYTDSAATYPEVWTAILHWQGVDYTRSCLSSLVHLTYPHVRTLLIINGSPDADRLALTQEFAGAAECLVLQENLGFAGGFNAGIKYCMERGAQWIWLLNNDTVVEPDSLSILMAQAIKNSRAAVLGASVHYSVITRPRHVPVRRGAFCVHPVFSKKPPAHRHAETHHALAEYLHHSNYPNCEEESCSKSVVTGPGQIDFWRAKTYLRPLKQTEQSAVMRSEWLSGSNLLLRCAALTNDYVFDPDYFLYFEDTEFCTRVRSRGWECLFVPGACVHHVGGASTTGDLEYWRAYYYTRNRLLFFGKALNTGSIFSKSLNALQAVPAFVSIFAHLLRHLLVLPFRGVAGCKQLKAEMLGLRDYLLRRFGKAACLDWCE